MGRIRIMEVSMKIRILIVALLISFPGLINAKATKTSKKQSAGIGLLKKSMESSRSKSNRIKITKAYHHKGTMSDKLVFYFSHRPICTYVPSASAAGAKGEEVPVNESGQVELEFFMPLTHAEKKPQQFLNQLGATDNDLYRVQFEPDYAKGGLTCRVLFRPDEIGFHQESFEPITGGHGLSFSFLKRKTMKDFNNKLRPLLRTVQVKKKSMLQWIVGMGTVTRVL